MSKPFTPLDPEYWDDLEESDALLFGIITIVLIVIGMGFCGWSGWKLLQSLLQR